MLLVKTRIQPSPIHGLGVFAAEDIKKGTVTWRYTEPVDYRVSPDSIIANSPFGSRFGYHPKNKNYIEFAGDSAMFINHSSDPNRARIEYADDITMVATRDIRMGEELTCDYRTFDEYPESGGKLD